MNEQNTNAILRAHKHIDKKYYGDPSYLLRKRVVNTCGNVLNKIEDIPFSELTTDMFFICNEVGFKYFSEKYRSALEFAKLQPEKLADQLYKMLRDTAREIKKNGKVEDFFLFLSLFEENTNVSEKYYELHLAYLDILMEQTEFLKPNIYDKNIMVAGVTTDGDILTTKDPIPDIDLPVYELTRSGKTGIEAALLLDKILKKHGIQSQEEFEFYTVASNGFGNNITLLVPYINEFTFDMLPFHVFAPSSNVTLIKTKQVDFKERLQKRHKTLPANGAVITFTDSIYLEKATLKELLYNNAIQMLCKFETVAGDVTVRYNTKTGTFFSPFDHTVGYSASLHETLKALSLWLYSAYVCPNEDILPSTESYHQYTDDENAVLTFTSIGGKPRPTIDKNNNRHLDYERYSEKSISIAGYIRKLPQGQKASPEKILLAKSLGLELADDETYVEPFIRKVWELKVVT